MDKMRTEVRGLAVKANHAKETVERMLKEMEDPQW
jgi:hypothetical protein